MSMFYLLAVAAGGVTGAVARYLVYIAVGHLLGSGFPYATLIVNIVGSFAMGVLVETMALGWNASIEMRLFLTTGILGAFTTFSAFSLDFALLYERRAFARAFRRPVPGASPGRAGDVAGDLPAGRDRPGHRGRLAASCPAEAAATQGRGW
jgi:CrcB protein